MYAPPPSTDIPEASVFPLMVESVTAQFPSELAMPEPAPPAPVISFPLIVEWSMSIVTLPSRPAPEVLKTSMPPPSPAST